MSAAGEPENAALVDFFKSLLDPAKIRLAKIERERVCEETIRQRRELSRRETVLLGLLIRRLAAYEQDFVTLVRDFARISVQIEVSTRPELNRPFILDAWLSIGDLHEIVRAEFTKHKMPLIAKNDIYSRELTLKRELATALKIADTNRYRAHGMQFDPQSIFLDLEATVAVLDHQVVCFERGTPWPVRDAPAFAFARMFQPENGRDGFGVVTVPPYLLMPGKLHPQDRGTLELPSEAVMSAVVDRECEIRLSAEAQALFRDPSVNDTRLIEVIQTAAGADYGLSSSMAIDLIRSAQVLYPDCEAVKRAHYVRFNRAAQGALLRGDAVPSTVLHRLCGTETTIAAFSREGRPLVVAAGSWT
eukprot:m.14695 g.14695  ORF g.14695 m.14695 type:complete len:361 (+) comp8439_c0_seq1:43-1125(+)